MPSVQIKDVPPKVHAELRRRAAAVGQSLQDYLLAQLVEATSRPTLDEVLERAGGRSGGKLSFASAVETIRRDRERH
jgi:plasmid stability protein